MTLIEMKGKELLASTINILGLEDDEPGGGAGLKFLDEGSVEGDLGKATDDVAAHERCVADFGVVDSEAQAVRQENAEGGEDA